ncbi:hypothetical protein [Pusillimonas sp.]|uniref:hypothetical protein n=1 Tax=Pusillimonas sp. TaxID=3040095 RepID=UPI002D7EC44A|nr:hypothetical protein [Pusillimonas sp.]
MRRDENAQLISSCPARQATYIGLDKTFNLSQPAASLFGTLDAQTSASARLKQAFAASKPDTASRHRGTTIITLTLHSSRRQKRRHAELKTAQHSGDPS